MKWGNNRRILVVEEFGVHNVDGFVSENDWRKEIQLTTFICTYNICWNILAMELIWTVSKSIFYLEGSPSSIHKFCNFPSVWFWLYLDLGLTASPTFNSVVDQFWFHCYLCVVCRSLKRIWRVDVANWELFKTRKRYSYIPDLPWFRVVRVWRSSMSNGKWNYRPTEATLLRISVLSTGALFLAYWELF